MGILRASFDWLVVVFFVTHIPVTLLVDSQAVFPRDYYPAWTTKLLNDFIRDYGDPLMTPPLEPWFKSLVYSEVFLQLPFFFIGAYAFVARKNWIRVPALCYGSFVVATMFPILATLATHQAPGYAPAPLIAFYLPYLLVPLGLVAVMAANRQPFAAGGTKGSGRGGSGKAKRG